MTDLQPDHSWENRYEILASLDPNATTPLGGLDTPTPGDADTGGTANTENPRATRSGTFDVPPRG